MDILAARRRAAEQAKAAQDVREAAPVAAADHPASDRPAALPVGGPGDAGPAAPVLPVHGETAPAACGAPGGSPGMPEDAADDVLEMLAFLLGSEEYVLPVDQVREVLKPRDITPVPHTPEYLLGVCSLRGTVLPVVDLARRLGLGAGAQDEKSRIIVAGTDTDDQIGLFVDRVRSVVRFPASAVRPVPDTVERGGEFLQGIARKDQRLFILLDVEKAAAMG